MTDTLYLKAAIVKKGYRISDIASALNLSVYGFSRKLHNKTEFKSSEIVKIQQLLDLTIEEKEAIFFKQNVDF